MGPKKHKRVYDLLLLTMVIALLIVMFTHDDFIGLLKSSLILLFFSLLSIFIKAKCDKCGFDMDKVCRKIKADGYMQIYECKKCGWIYDTGEKCDE